MLAEWTHSQTRYYCRWVYLGEGKPVKDYGAILCCTSLLKRCTLKSGEDLYLNTHICNKYDHFDHNSENMDCLFLIHNLLKFTHPKSIPSTVTELLNNHPGVQNIQLFKKWWFRNAGFRLQIIGRVFEYVNIFCDLVKAVTPPNYTLFILVALAPWPPPVWPKDWWSLSTIFSLERASFFFF